MDYKDKTFENKRVELSDGRFHGCTFKNCELVYRGEPSPTFQDNEFIDSTFVFRDDAIRTLYFLSNIYHAGEGGREIVEQTFDDVRNRTIHGSETSTIKPHTPEHTLHG
jgi:hypothetical protein